ncbi:C-type lectin domain family 2 member B-like [Anolis sagrei]|uniref:C-type lectin domain family 2 member B-like n=1 Tax=Anolis sagrei TaxID=38937 RepID=UPI003522AAC9
MSDNENYLKPNSSAEALIKENCEDRLNPSEQTEQTRMEYNFDRGQKAKWRKNVIFAVFIIGSNAFAAFISVMLTRSPCDLCPATTVLSCPAEWVGYEGKCYYFSESEGTWSSSQTNCSASTASLVAIDSQKEMNFIMQHKKATDYWIGLKRKEGQPWEWANGSVFNGWFEIRANGFCAYLNDEKASSTWCNTQRNWICSKTAHSTWKSLEDFPTQML